MWVVKTHGETFYVNHVTSDMPWSTKETPDNYHTKGSIKFKDCLLVINDDNEATFSNLTIYDKFRLRNQKLGITRVIFSYGGKVHKALQANEFKHSPFKNVSGGCGTSFVICDILDKNEHLFMAIKYGEDYRILKPNEGYYKDYDNSGVWVEERYEDDEDDE